MADAAEGKAYLDAMQAAEEANPPAQGTAGTSTDPVGLPGQPGATPGGLPEGYVAPNSPENTTAQQWVAWNAYLNNPTLQQQIQTEYGYSSWLLSIPGMGPIMAAAAMYGWSQPEVDGAVSKTSWYKTASQAQRAWQTMQQTDPASAAQQVSQNTLDVQGIAQTLGVNLSQSQLTQISTTMAEFGLSATEITQTIKDQFSSQLATGTGGVPTVGTASSFYDQAQNMVQQYAVPVSSSTLQSWTKNAVAGTADINGFENYLRQQALSLYPYMSTAINQGMTPQQWLSPYTQSASSLLDVSPDSIDWTSPKWQQALTQTSPDGQRTALNLTAFNKSLMSDPTYGYQNTEGAIQQAYGLASTVEGMFGKTSGAPAQYTPASI